MKKSQTDKTPAAADVRSRTATAARTGAAELQPPATGANSGSPAAPVMKQFAKTKAESGGRS